MENRYVDSLESGHHAAIRGIQVGMHLQPPRARGDMSGPEQNFSKAGSSPPTRAVEGSFVRAAHLGVVRPVALHLLDKCVLPCGRVLQKCEGAW